MLLSIVSFNHHSKSRRKIAFPSGKAEVEFIEVKLLVGTDV